MTAADLAFIERRNANLRIYRQDGCLYVAKCYHARYTIEAEAAAYLLVEDIIRNIAGIKVAKVKAIDDLSQEIHLEFIAGPTLAQILSRQGITALDRSWIKSVLELSVAAHFQQLKLDVDPSNFILDENDGQLTFIDPIIDSPDMQHTAATIFLWGLVKYRVRYFYRFWEWRPYLTVWRGFVNGYTNKVNVHSGALYQDLATYAKEVIKWNIRESDGESYGMRVFRALALVPVWWLVQKWFWIHGKRSL